MKLSEQIDLLYEAARSVAIHKDLSLAMSSAATALAVMSEHSANPIRLHMDAGAVGTEMIGYIERLHTSIGDSEQRVSELEQEVRALNARAVELGSNFKTTHEALERVTQENLTLKEEIDKQSQSVVDTAKIMPPQFSKEQLRLILVLVRQQYFDLANHHANLARMLSVPEAKLTLAPISELVDKVSDLIHEEN